MPCGRGPAVEGGLFCNAPHYCDQMPRFKPMGHACHAGHRAISAISGHCGPCQVGQIGSNQDQADMAMTKTAGPETRPYTAKAKKRLEPYLPLDRFAMPMAAATTAAIAMALSTKSAVAEAISLM
jgi:hypothetical protein